ncbi:hypothetical protein GCM10028820_04240 [Tessaracoccus terricola]
MRLRTGPGRGGYVVAALLWLGGWLGLFAAGHAAWWEAGRPGTAEGVVAGDGLLALVPIICLGLVTAGFIVWLFVNRARSSARRKLLVGAAAPAPTGWEG